MQRICKTLTAKFKSVLNNGPLPQLFAAVKNKGCLSISWENKETTECTNMQTEVKQKTHVEKKQELSYCG